MTTLEAIPALHTQCGGAKHADFTVTSSMLQLFWFSTYSQPGPLRSFLAGGNMN